MNITNLVKRLLFWRVLLFVPLLLGVWFLPFEFSFPYKESILDPAGSYFLTAWAHFDGVHYLGIAANGYFAQYTQAFFPVYPLLIRFLGQVLGSDLIAGLLLSHLSLIAWLVMLYKLLRLDYSKVVTQKTLILLMIFPTAFFWGSLYTESFFMLLVVSSFYLLRTKRFWQAFFLVALASGTRVVGVFLWPALVWEIYQNFKGENYLKLGKKLLPSIIAPIGLLLYMYYLHVNFDDPLYFLHAQPAFGAERSSDRLILLYQVVYRYIKMLVTVQIDSWLYLRVIQEFLISLSFVGLSVGSFFKIRQSYAIFALAALITPTLTGTFSSMPRYALVAFPVFVLMAQVKNKKIYQLLLTIFAILLFVNTMLFTRGYFVA